MSDSTLSHCEEESLCPSAPCRPGALLLGVVSRDGKLLRSNPAVSIDTNFCMSASVFEDPAKRFRFASTCLKQECSNWESGCKIAKGLMSLDCSSGDIPKCSIRPECRWYKEAGTSVCKRCNLVVTAGAD